MNQSKKLNYWNNSQYGLKSCQKLTKDHILLVLPQKSVPGVTLEIYENLIKIIPAGYIPPNNTPPERENFEIKSFSQKSRMKLFTIFNKINYSEYGVPLFLSATWHFDNPDTRQEIKSTLEYFLAMLKRYFPPFHYIWKLEYQKRGIPHFHILLFPLNKNDKFFSDQAEKFIKVKWMQLKTCKCEHCKNYSMKVIECYTRMMSIAYIAKEIAKVEERYEAHNLGRIWGRSQNLKTKMINKFDTTMEFANLIIDEKLKENFKHPFQKEYIESLKDTIEPRSIFGDTSKLKTILQQAKVASLPADRQLKKYFLKRKQNDCDLKRIKSIN